MVTYYDNGNNFGNYDNYDIDYSDDKINDVMYGDGKNSNGSIRSLVSVIC